jgi:hypothetical protein
MPQFESYATRDGLPTAAAKQLGAKAGGTKVWLLQNHYQDC